MSDSENSDDERYANESFENESDTEIPEMTEIESESTENSDEDDALPSVKLNTGRVKRSNFPNRLSASNNTDIIPFASSSDEEDDVIVGQTLAEINTPSMHLMEESVISPPISIPQENYHRLKNLQKQDESLDDFSDENDEEEFQKIRDMEEIYLQQNSAKTPKNENVNNTLKNNSMEENQTYLTTTDEESEEQEAETETEIEIEPEMVTKETKLRNSNVNPIESKEDYEENNTQEIKCSEPKLINEVLENNTDMEHPFEYENLMQMIQNSLNNLTTSQNVNERPSELQQSTLMDDNNSIMSSNANLPTKFNPQNIALALVNALKSNALTNLQKEGNDQQKQNDRQTEKEIRQKSNNDDHLEKCETHDKEEKGEEINVEADECAADRDEELEEIQNNEYVHELDYDDDDDVYYNSQFHYRITSKTPSSFNSEDYIFHANFIKPFHRTQSTDKLRIKPHGRKSMSFSNERMREIERHNQILLRKILTQKPTYTAKNKSAQPPTHKLPSQTNQRTTTSAVNRKKQQRQIDLDNQVLKRKIEAISLRRRPVIS